MFNNRELTKLIIFTDKVKYYETIKMSYRVTFNDLRKYFDIL